MITKTTAATKALMTLNSVLLNISTAGKDSVTGKELKRD
jgi:hypothetical protein